MVFNAEFVPEHLRRETEELIIYTSKNLKFFTFFLFMQMAIDGSYLATSIINRNASYIEMSRFYGEISIYKQ